MMATAKMRGKNRIFIVSPENPPLPFVPDHGASQTSTDAPRSPYPQQWL
jgi:hypothetical protein